MKLTTFELMRIWADITGLLLFAFWAGALLLGFQTSEMLPMLITAVGGFQLFHVVQDLMIRRRSA
ncbi:hypothetical protein [Novosphingobium sp. TH158]|uniref:hypothetical protein n=1 Tax=Novosphingobium sp. TH158 TaxID=2067455 RepID=UPI000C7A45B6|nr:hypothetical protein [Novosphingobium sp. TH158]PLK25800.1 hypothetical protein C0V78_01995 [Novosphingobium sp. TH158]